jgi:hypothetical protein
MVFLSEYMFWAKLIGLLAVARVRLKKVMAFAAWKAVVLDT